MSRVMTTDRKPDGTLDVHAPDYHAEVTAEKIVVVGESASAEVVSASRAFRKSVEAILLRHHADTHQIEQAALAKHGAARYEHPLNADSAATGHSVVEASILADIVAAARGTVLESHFARADVQAAVLNEIHHETRSQMQVHRAVHAANAAEASKRSA